MSAAGGPGSEPLIRFAGVALGYGRRPVIEDVRFDVPRGGYVGIVGPNGSGKTTLLRGALGLLAPLRGEIVRSGSRRVGYVPQRVRLDPIFPLRARDVVMMGRYPHVGPLRRPGRDDRRAVEVACERLAIGHLQDEPYRDLSGGQQQRVLLARALATEPDLLVLDEPTNGMDLPSEHGIVEVIGELHREHGVTVLFVTHLLHLVANAATDLVILSAATAERTGRARCGPRDAILTPEVLTEIYGLPVEVHVVGGRRAFFVGVAAGTP